MKELQLLKKATEDSEKISLLKEIRKKTAKNKRASVVTSVLYNITCAFSITVMLCYVFMLLCTDEEREVMALVSPIYVKIYDFFTMLFTDTLSIVLYSLVFVVIVPTLLTLLFRFFFVLFPANGKKVPKADENSLSKNCEITYKYVKSYQKLHYSIWIALFFSFATFASHVILLYSCNGSIPAKLMFTDSVPTMICAAIIALLGSYVILTIVTAPGVVITQLGIRYDRELASKLEIYWIENDPKEEKMRRTYAEKRSSDVSEKQAEISRTPTLTIHTRSVASMNKIIVLIDNSENTSYFGGIDKTIAVPEGEHTVALNIYNSASDSTYEIASIDKNFEAFGHYDLDVG